MQTAVQVTIYLNESDKWNQILHLLRQENVASASAFHAVAGFNGRSDVHTSGFIEAGGDLPVVIVFVDLEEHISRVIPKLCELAPGRLIVRENVLVEQSTL